MLILKPHLRHLPRFPTTERNRTAHQREPTAQGSERQGGQEEREVDTGQHVGRLRKGYRRLLLQRTAQPQPLLNSRFKSCEEGDNEECTIAR